MKFKCAKQNLLLPIFLLVRLRLHESRQNFLNGQILPLQTVLHYCFLESVQIFASVSIGMALF